MGNTPTLPVQDVNAKVHEVLSLFSPTFVKHCRLQMMESLRSEPLKNYSLLEQEPESTVPQVLGKGMLTKMGEISVVGDSWKARYFVGLGRSDNYEVRYYVDQAAYLAGKDPKGVIQLCWYKVKRHTVREDLLRYGLFSLRLVPWWALDRRRTYYLKAENEETIKIWMEILQTATKSAEAPISKDFFVRKAFMDAYRETRYAIGEYGWYYLCTDEARTLSMMIASRCEKICLREIYAKLPGGSDDPGRFKLADALDKHVTQMAMMQWNSDVVFCNAMKRPLDESIATIGLSNITEKENEINKALTGALNAVLQPAISAATSKSVRAIVTAIFPYFAASYRSAIGIFANVVIAAAAAEAKNPFSPSSSVYGDASGAGIKVGDDAMICAGAVHDYISDFLLRVHVTSYSPLASTFVLVQNMIDYKPLTSVPGAPASNSSSSSSSSSAVSSTPRASMVVARPNMEELLSLMNGIELWLVGREQERDLRKYSRDAAYSFRHVVGEAINAIRETPHAESPGGATVALQTTLALVLLPSFIAQYAHDAQVQSMTRLRGIMVDAMLPGIVKLILPQAKAILSKCQDSISEDMKEVIDTQVLLMRLIEQTLTSAVTSAMLPHAAALLGPIALSVEEVSASVGSILKEQCDAARAVLTEELPSILSTAVPDFKETFSSGIDGSKAIWNMLSRASPMEVFLPKIVPPTSPPEAAALAAAEQTRGEVVNNSTTSVEAGSSSVSPTAATASSASSSTTAASPAAASPSSDEGSSSVAKKAAPEEVVAAATVEAEATSSAPASSAAEASATSSAEAPATSSAEAPASSSAVEAPATSSSTSNSEKAEVAAESASSSSSSSSEEKGAAPAVEEKASAAEVTPAAEEASEKKAEGETKL